MVVKINTPQRIKKARMCYQYISGGPFITVLVNVLLGLVLEPVIAPWGWDAALITKEGLERKGIIGCCFATALILRLVTAFPARIAVEVGKVVFMAQLKQILLEWPRDRTLLLSAAGVKSFSTTKDIENI